MNHCKWVMPGGVTRLFCVLLSRFMKNVIFYGK